MITLDTSGLLAALDPGQTQHSRAKSILQSAQPPFLLSPFVLAELDYLINKFVGPKAARELLREVATGAYHLVSLTNNDIAECLQLIEVYSDLNIGVADASVWHIAQLYGSYDILTLDERHFRVLAGRSGGRFRLVPADI